MPAGRPVRPASVPLGELDAKQVMLQLWMEHVALTRAVLVAKVWSLPDEKLVVNRLLANQDHIAWLFLKQLPKALARPTAVAVANLLREHIVIAGAIIDALIGRRPARDAAGLIGDWAENGWKLADALYALQQQLGKNVGNRAAWRRHFTYATRPRALAPAGRGHLDILARLVKAYVARDYAQADGPLLDANLKQAAGMAAHLAALLA